CSPCSSKRRAQQAARPVRAALHSSRRDAHQLRHLGDRPVLLVHQPPDLAVGAAGRAEHRGRGDLEVRARGRRLGQVPGGAAALVQQGHGRRPALAQQQGGLVAGDHPEPGGGGTARLVGPGVLPHREERLLQRVLDVVRRQRLAEPGGQPRGMPLKQLAQRHVVTASQARDQLVVVHRLVYCSRRAAGSRSGGKLRLASYAVTVMTCLPRAPPWLNAWCAATMLASGNTPLTTGRSAPEATYPDRSAKMALSGLALNVRMRRDPWMADRPIAASAEADSPTVTIRPFLVSLRR